MRAQTKFLFAAGPILAAFLGLASLGQAAPWAAGATPAQIAHETPAAGVRAEGAHYAGYGHHHGRYYRNHRNHSHYHYHGHHGHRHYHHGGHHRR